MGLPPWSLVLAFIISFSSDLTLDSESFRNRACLESNLTSKMSLLQTLYHGVAKRTSTLVLAIGVTAFGFERGFDYATTYLWESSNRGKLWKDIAHKYVQKEEEDDE